MILLVNDANILIDLLALDLLDEFFSLEYDFHVTDIVFAEIRDDTSGRLEPFMATGILKKKSFTYEELTQIQQLEVDYRQLSIADCSCLFHARSLSACLLTGDAALRKSAEQGGISVHGILWVLDELVAKNVITTKKAHEKLTSLTSINPRLPSGACRSRLKKWQKEK
jgi:predicted nucleic acid-binding protein